MLRLIPEKRAKASELIHHAWLESVVVQGEVDIIRRAEEEDVRKREHAPTQPVAISGSQTRPLGHLQQEEANEADAMKPVDDLAMEENVPKISVPVPGSSSAGGKENTSGSRGVPKLSSVSHAKHS
jgi:serine/threonine-protein kinase SRPK3